MSKKPELLPGFQSLSLNALTQKYFENRNRNAHPLDQAKLVKAMIATGQIAPAALVQKLDKLRSTISELAKFATFPEQAQRTFVDKKVSYSSLREINRLDASPFAP
jgi:hypothetical protein